jgi:heptose-I-phosphate ethanolaminephosphotransferase
MINRQKIQSLLTTAMLNNPPHLIQKIRALNVFEPLTLRFTFLCCYPFLITSFLLLFDSPNVYLASRVVVAAIYNVTFFLIVTCVLRLVRPRLSAWLKRSLLVLLALFTVGSVMHFLLYRQLIGLPSIYSIIDTTPDESSEFVHSMIRLDQLTVAFVLAAPLLWLAVRFPHLPSLAVRRRVLAIASTICLLVGLSSVGYLRYYFYLNNPLLLISYTLPNAILEKVSLQRLYAKMPAPGTVTMREGAEKPVTHVLVIGESTTSRHMSLYNYFRKTTPELDKLKSGFEIVLDACSSRGNTTQQLKELLTFATRDDHDPLFKTPSLVQIMKSAGFKTFWLSNQQQFGAVDTWSGIFSKPADVRIFVDRRGFGFEGTSHDDRLLPLFRDALSDPARQRFIIIHLMGAHMIYDRRYPEEFAQFNDHQGVPERVANLVRYNSYDNAVLYNDFIISEIIKLFRNVEYGTLTFLSDHGQVLGETSDFWGHIDGPMPRQGYQVPLFFYFTSSFKTSLGSRLTDLRRNLTTPMQTDWLIHTLLDLYGVGHAAWRKERSMLSPLFSPGPRYCDTLTP